MQQSTIQLGGGSGESADRGLGFAVGQTIGRYRLEASVGAGGMGVVFVATDPSLHRRVAIKLVRPGRGGAEARARMVREAQAMATISHPNVVEVFDVGVVDDVVFIAMEFIDGITLGAWLEQRPPVHEILDVFAQAGAGLAAAHEAGLVHRDFKPANVLLGHDGRARVLDFGLAAAPTTTASRSSERSADAADAPSGAPSESLTRTGTIMGTPAYMAPEQHLGRPADARADQYAFCVALYRGLYRQLPFEGQTHDELAQHKALGHLRGAPREPGVPRHLAAVLRRGLHPDPERRFPSMDAVLEAMRPRRRRATVVVLAGLGALGLAAAVAEPRAPGRCASSEATATQTLGPAQAELRDALDRGGGAHAADTVRGVDARLDAYVRQWTQTHREVCVAGAEAPLLELETRRRCLRRDLEQTAGLLRALAGADPEHRSRAVSVVSRLPSPSRCATLRPSDDVAARSGIAEADRSAYESALDRIAAAGAVGDYAGAVAEARRAVALAHDAQAPALVAHARNRLGAALVADGKFEAARAEHEAAFFSARELSDDVIAEEAATALVYVVGSALSRPSEGETWTRHARTHLERIGRPARREAAFLRNLGTLQEGQGNTLACKETHAQALALLREIHGEAHPDIAIELAAKAGCQEDQGEFEAAGAGYEEALAMYEKLLGPSHPDLIHPLNNLGLFLEHTGDDERALALHERALALAETGLDPNHPRRAQTLGSLANVLRQLGRFDEAMDRYREALEIFIRNFGDNHLTVAEVHHNMGAVEIMRGNYLQAVLHNSNALQVRLELLGPNHSSTGMSYGNLGALHQHLGEYEQAIDAYQHAQKIFAQTMGTRHPIIGSALTDEAMALFELGRYEEAIDRCERALQYPDIPMEGPTSHASARFVLAASLWEVGRDRRRALALAREAEAEFERRGRPVQGELQEVRTWLAARQ